MLMERKMRSSHYNNYIPISDGRVLLLHGLTGAVQVHHEMVAKKLENGDFDFHGTDLKKLKQGGFITTDSKEEEIVEVCRSAGCCHDSFKGQSASYVLVPSYFCNFRCPYCFEEEVQQKRKEEFAVNHMTPDTVSAVFTAIQELEEGKNIESRSFTLYGGEPLLPSNRKCIEAILDNPFFKEKGGSIGAITNGYTLEHYEDLLGPDKIATLQITMDGPAEIHNRYRILKNGGKTFDTIVRNITLALEKGVVVNLRCNIDDNNVGRIDELEAVITGNRWDTYSNFSAYSSEIYGDFPGGISNYTLACKTEHLNVISSPLEKMKETLTKELSGSDFTYIPPSAPVYCSASTSMTVFDPFGDIYPCWEAAGTEELKVGTVDLKSGTPTIDSDKLKDWLSRSIATSTPCRECSVALFCGGGCGFKSLKKSGSIHKGFCNETRKLLYKTVEQLFYERETAL